MACECSNTPAADGDRRGFLAKTTAILAGGIALLVPAGMGLCSWLNPMRQKSASGTFKLADLDDLPEDGTPKLVQVITDRTDAWSRFPAEPIGSVFLRRAAENEVEAFQAKCPHAGCTIQYQAAKASEESKSDEPLGKFFCPCHAAAFGLAGERLDEVSASPRDMDSLEVDIRDGEVWVTFQNFKMGSSAKEPTA